MKKIIINLKTKSYPITISSGLLKNFNAFWPLKKGDQAMIITNEILAPIYLDNIKNILEKNFIKLDCIIISDGEKFKNLSTANTIFTELITKMHGRDTTLIALGGGVIGDLTGFVAATYQRGVRFIQIPTTLLSQVDASVGGKTAVNHVYGKNMIGVFYQPDSVLIDLDFLKTLPLRQLKSGIAEVIKYGIIIDSKFFSWIEQNIDLLLSLNNSTVEYCVNRCCKIKSSIVSTDEHELNIRMILNLGHTYGHAIETFMKYHHDWLHGEAISVGIMMASKASLLMNKINDNDFFRIKILLDKIGLPIKGPSKMTVEDYFVSMKHDKKVISNVLRIVLPMKIGKAKVFNNLKKSLISKSIQYCM